LRMIAKPFFVFANVENDCKNIFMFANLYDKQWETTSLFYVIDSGMPGDRDALKFLVCTKYILTI
jgi:hypothetical protein